MVWQLVFAGYFLPAARTGMQVVVAAAAMTAALVAHDDDSHGPDGRWL